MVIVMQCMLSVFMYTIFDMHAYMEEKALIILRLAAATVV